MARPSLFSLDHRSLAPLFTPGQIFGEGRPMLHLPAPSKALFPGPKLLESKGRVNIVFNKRACLTVQSGAKNGAATESSSEDSNTNLFSNSGFARGSFQKDSSAAAAANSAETAFGVSAAKTTQQLPQFYPNAMDGDFDQSSHGFLSKEGEGPSRNGKGSNWRNLVNLNHWVVQDYYKLVSRVNALEMRMQRLTDEQLKSKTHEFRQRIKAGETLEDLQAEAFAVVREASRRVLGMRHFDVQIIGGAVLHDGAIAEMKTGEGKTLVSPLAAYLNALTGEGVHIITVNDYLAQRDAEWMGRIHRFLGLSVGLIQSGMNNAEKKAAYSCDITFTNNTEIGFDYLRDNISQQKEAQVLRWPRPFNYAIVDEVDSVLIDEGRNPLIISTTSSKDVVRFPVAAKVAELLVRKQHYTTQPMEKSVELTEEGITAAELALDTDDLWSEKDPWARFVVSALCAKEFYQRDVDYIVKDGAVQIVDEFTGRVVENRRWSDGLHQSVEAKEGVEIREETVVAAQITNQSLYRLYSKTSGMTGTAKTEEKEFLSIFQMPVVEVPTNLPNIRVDLPLQLYPTMEGKWLGVKEEVLQMYEHGRPVLVGTTSVEQSEILSELLKEIGLSHNVLNARPKYAAREAEIVAQAGRKRAITISTNMAGRGTDIILGGNPEMLAKEAIEEMVLPMLTKEAVGAVAAAPSIVFSRVRFSPASRAKLAKAAVTAKYVVGKGGENWNYTEAKRKVASFLDLPLQKTEQELEIMAGCQGAETITLGAAVAVAYLSVLKDCQAHCLKEGDEVKAVGGLHVIGTSLHESRRIDNQLRGRAGRQGDPGSTRFMISFEDELIQKTIDKNIFVTNWIPWDTVISDSSFLEKQVVNIQRFMESHNSNIRKSLVDYEEVLEVQRKHVYNLRQQFLNSDMDSCRQLLYQYIQTVADELVILHVNLNKHPKTWNIKQILEDVQGILNEVSEEHKGKLFELPSETSILSSLAQIRGVKTTGIDEPSLPGLPLPSSHRFSGPRCKASAVNRWSRMISDGAFNNRRYEKESLLLRRYFGELLIGVYQEKIFISDVSPKDVEQTERMLAISALDVFWREHLINMSRLRSAVNVRSFGNLNPLEEYKIESLRFFISMLSSFRRLTVESLLRPWQVEMLDALKERA
ncbi:hypothetical protein GOP47_0014701 [Adiantum capillus-veneris]|uniref:Protein translocase subunit SecA n=1 Tax=Adiantum capillus-veneris TaxID=13818 RepID=A0A9D4ZCE8_ADICA|nr:hypothetical protein GOP47_0014701 [Adiantum capillus-veneris]